MQTGMNNKTDALKKATSLLATILGILATFLFAPQLYHASVNWALGYASAQYGGGWGFLVSVFWAILCSLAAFGLSSIFVTMTVRIGLARISALGLHR